MKSMKVCITVYNIIWSLTIPAYQAIVVVQYNMSTLIVKVFKVMNLSFITKGDKRTVKAKKNILYSVGIKGLDSIVQLLLVPVALGYLNPYEYGIWLTLNSILVWINSCDIGLGNGLRNQLAVAVANNDIKLAKTLVSTAYCMIFAIMAIIVILGLLIITNLDWYHILGARIEEVQNLMNIVIYTFILFCMNFIMKFIGNIYMAMQMPSINNFMVFMGHTLALILIFVLTKTTSGNLLYIAIAFSISPIIVYTIAYPITFKYVYRELLPSVRCFQSKYLKRLMNVGISFFVLQVSGIVLFSLSNIIISRLFGPELVTPYNISFRYFNLVTMIISLLITPMWSATTDAYAKREYGWINNNLKKTDKILCILGLFVIFMVLISKLVYRLWVGNQIIIPFALTSLMALYSFILTSSAAYSIYLNGMGKLKLQIINTVIAAVLYLPLTYYLGTTMGINGVVISMCLLNVSGLILNRIQLYKIITCKATGIWIK